MGQLVAQNNDTSLSQQFSLVVDMIRQAKKDVVKIANTRLIDLYWQIGRYISQRIAQADWGDGVVDQLAEYISAKSPDTKGFSNKNLWRMRQFYETYSAADEKLSPLVREITWTNNLIILSRSKSEEERSFYIQLCIRERLSKRDLNRQFDSALYERSKLNKPYLSPAVRDISTDATQLFRDHYVMEFLGEKEFNHENSLRSALVAHMKRFILELGRDFIFVDEEYRLQVGNSDFRIDLLFFHRELQCLVAFEIKMEKFKPEHLGQLNFYLEALDRDVKKSKENPSIGVLLCKDKDNEVVEYALSRTLSPALVAEYELCLPDKKLLQEKMQDLFEHSEIDSN